MICQTVCLILNQEYLYADDTHLKYADRDIDSIQVSLNQDLININHWLIVNKLTLNTSKTDYTLIGSKQKMNTLHTSSSLEMNGSPFNRVNYTKSPGVLIDENLTWRNHIDALSKKISSGIGSIKRVRHWLPPGTLLNIYHGLVQSNFDYCSVVWRSCGKILFNKLQKTSKSCSSCTHLLLLWCWRSPITKKAN